MWGFEYLNSVSRGLGVCRCVRVDYIGMVTVRGAPSKSFFRAVVPVLNFSGGELLELYYNVWAHVESLAVLVGGLQCCSTQLADFFWCVP